MPETPYLRYFCPVWQRTILPLSFLWRKIREQRNKMKVQRNGGGGGCILPFRWSFTVSLEKCRFFPQLPFLWCFSPFLCIKIRGAFRTPNSFYTVILLPSLNRKTIPPSLHIVTWSTAFSHKSSENSVITSCPRSVSA